MNSRNGNATKGVVTVLAVLGIASTVLIWSQYRNKEPAPTRTTLADLVESEDLILELTPKLKKLNRSVNKGQLPSQSGKSLFAKTVSLGDITEQETESESFNFIDSKSFQREIGNATKLELESLRIWHPVLDKIEVGSFRSAGFKIVRGNFSKQEGKNSHQGSDTSRFETFVKFDGLAQLKEGPWISIHATQSVNWKNFADPDSNKSDWKIVSWDQDTFEISTREQMMFRDVLTEAIPTEHQEGLLNSLNDQFIVRYFHDKKLNLPFPDLKQFLTGDTMMAHPSVSVVDINNDGWDDLYVMTRWRRNRMFVNNQDGTFHEAAAEMGLDWDRTSSAIFADLDNDGDKDVFLGRCFAESKLLVNENGKFVDRTAEQIEEELPGFITSISAADYDNDGLLDLYLSSHLVIGTGGQAEERAAKYMPKDHAKELISWYDKMEPSDMWLKRPGPPNRLLKNLGNGKFAKSDAIIDIWSNTFQATWADYDEDGDVDLYLCNDFSPDYLFRNDGEAGFVDVTEMVGGPTMRGYGMGATWGDYNNDGLQDLYISNMYSKAGKRILSQLPEVDNKFFLSANGNRLFENTESQTLKLVSGEDESEQQVTKAGWSWGGQFSDFDNDGFLDIYVSSGFYTAPEEIACDEDL